MPAFVQQAISADNGSGTTVSVTISVGTAGNLICGYVTWAEPQTLTNVKDNNGITYNIVDNQDDAGLGLFMAAFYKENISGAPASIIAPVSASKTGTRIEVQEWSGIATTSPLDGHAMQLDVTGATISSGNIITTAAGDLVYGSSLDGISNGALSAGSGFTIRNNGSGAGFVRRMADESQIQSAAGSIAATFGLSPSADTGIAAVMAFKAAGPSSGISVAKQNFKVDKFKTPSRSMGPNAGLFQVKAFPIAASVDTLTPYVSRPFSPQQWSLNTQLLRGTAQDTSSSAVETNPHWQGRQWPAQWNVTRALRQTIPEDFGSSAVETNPHWASKKWPLQWIVNLSLGRNTAQDFSSSAVETNVHFIPRPWSAPWGATKALWQKAATDTQVAATPD